MNNGFARVKYQDCGTEFLLASSENTAASN
jgi:hypothetical protein